MLKPDVREALRYIGAQNPPDELLRQADALAAQLAAAVQPRYTYRIYGLDILEDRVRLQGAQIELPGTSAMKMLSGCDRAALLACTLGARFDALLLSAQARDMSNAVIYDALGSAFVEAGCNKAEEDISDHFPDVYLTDRFSPGYGDLPLAVQPGICAALDASRRLGITVTPSLLMNPVKSVTAVIGLSDAPQPARIRGCVSCKMQDTCQFRKEGKSCGA